MMLVEGFAGCNLSEVEGVEICGCGEKGVANINI